MKRIAVFSAICAVAIAAVLLLSWSLTGFSDLGLSTHGFAALTIGIVLSSAVAIALMALIFHSGRSHDDRIEVRFDASPPADDLAGGPVVRHDGGGAQPQGPRKGSPV